jgi:hypothetical protein
MTWVAATGSPSSRWLSKVAQFGLPHCIALAMANIFPRWSNLLPLKIAVCAGSAAAGSRSPSPTTRRPRPWWSATSRPADSVLAQDPRRPARLDCRYCHSFVDVSGHSNVPTATPAGTATSTSSATARSSSRCTARWTRPSRLRRQADRVGAGPQDPRTTSISTTRRT